MKGLDRRQPLGDPGAAVEQLGAVAERRVVDLDRRAAEALEPCDRRVVERLGLGVAEELALGLREHAEAEALCDERRRPMGPREGIARVEPLDHPADRRRVADRAGEDRDAVDAAAGRDEPGRGNEADRRLDPDEIVEGGGAPGPIRRCRCRGRKRRGRRRSPPPSPRRSRRRRGRRRRPSAARHRASECR